jgi:hypothetical protein
MIETTAIFLLGVSAGIIVFLGLAFLLIRPWLSRLLHEETGALPKLIRVTGEVADRLADIDDSLEIFDTRWQDYLQEQEEAKRFE